MPAAGRDWYSFAIVRVVPRVEREEFLNVGVILFARTRRFLDARIELDEERLKALAPEIDLAAIRRHLEAFHAVCTGSESGGPIAALPLSDRFHWLTAPRSTVIQTSPIHVGCGDDLPAAMAELLDDFVRSPEPHRG